MNRAAKILVSVFFFYLALMFLNLPNVSADIVIDNGDPGTSSTGTWSISGGEIPYDPGDPDATSLWSRNGSTYTWQFDSEPPGTYEILMWWSAYHSRANSIDVDISHHDGTQTININQQENASQWDSQGQYYFNGNGSVTITAATGSTVSTCADAVWFKLISASPLAVSPTNPTVSTGGVVDFDATGGVPSYTFSLSVNNSGGNIDPDTGLYTAGPTGGVTDTVEVTDSDTPSPSTVSTNVTVTAAPPLAISPTTATVQVGDSQSFSATGGEPPYSFSLFDNQSGATIVAATGAYTAGSTGGVTDTVRVTDNAAATADATVTVTAAAALIDQTNWTLHDVDSEEIVGENGAAVNAFDGDQLTVWHTEWYLTNPDPAHPHEIQIDLGAIYDIEGFRYLPRGCLENGCINGRISLYEFYVSTNGVDWGNAVAEGIFVNDATEKEVLFSPVTAQYVRLIALSEVNGNPWTSMAELNVLGTIPAALAISPTTATVQVGDSQNFSATGGEPPYSFSLFDNQSGATIVAATGAYTAGSTGGVTDTVRVTDNAAATADATVTVTAAPPLAISPTNPTVSTGGTVDFDATGGVPSHTFSLSVNNSGGNIDPDTGLYTAGPTGGVTDTVEITDSDTPSPATVTTNVTVTDTPSPLAVSPTNPTVSAGATVDFNATGGVPSYTFSLSVNNSGGNIDPDTGLYTAGPTGGVTDTVEVTDSDTPSPTTVSTNVTVTDTLPSLVIDNDDPETSFTGTWSVSGGTAPYGSDSLWARDGATYTWTFSPFVSGYYPVSMYWTYWPSRSTDVPVDIEHAGGTTTISVNQQQELSDWYSLGYYLFESGVDYDLTITSQPAPTSTCADAVAFGEPTSQHGSTEQIFACMGYFDASSPKYELISMLQNIGAQQEEDDIWSYQNEITEKNYLVHIVEDIEGMKQALRTLESTVVYSGHSNYGLGALFATPAEISAKTIDDILYIDDDRILTLSSPCIHVRCPGMRTSQAYPNWWWAFQDGTLGVMPYVFYDPAGDPPYNYYITYQIPGDPTYYKVESVHNSAIERFGCDRPAWYSSDGFSPDATNPEHQQYFITTPTPWYPSFEAIGTWTGSKAISGYFKENYIYTAGDSSGDSAEWTLRIPKSGNYRIFAWWPASANWSYNAPYTVNDSLGTTTVFRNQKLNGNSWNSIGEFFFDPGQYSVVLSDDADGGSVVADAIRIAHIEDPSDIVQANFYAKVRNGSAPLEVDFVSQSTGDITYLKWYFGNGKTKENREQISNDYYAGTYTVSLTVSGPSGTDTLTKVGYVTVGNLPPSLKAEFSKELYTDTVPLGVSFQDWSSGDIESWYWEFGDGEISHQQNPTHTYTNVGYYTVSLTVTDANNNSVTETKQNFINANVLSCSLDNVDYPKPHCGEKAILFRKDLEISKEELKYSRLFYNGCSTAKYYLETFSHGIVFYTTDTSDAQIWRFVKAYLEGKSDEEIWEILQDYEPIYDYYDFSKTPMGQ